MKYLGENPYPAATFNSPSKIGTYRQAKYSDKVAPHADRFTVFNFTSTLVPLEGGQQFLKLLHPLKLRVDTERLKFHVEDWDIEMDCLNLPQLPREVARKFLKLLHSAGNNSQTEQEQAAWLKISKYIDYQQFSIDRSPPRYMEGTVNRRGDVVSVKWHDGSKEILARSAASALSDVNDGEPFSAWVKLGRDDTTVAIERVLLLPDQELEWETWPPKG